MFSSSCDDFRLVQQMGKLILSYHWVQALVSFLVLHVLKTVDFYMHHEQNWGPFKGSSL